MMGQRRFAAVTICVIVFMACRGESIETVGMWTGTIDTLESGRLHIRNPSTGAWPQDESWELRERFRLGSLDGEGPEVFGSIPDVEIGPAGELYILDSQASEIRVFDLAGEYLRSFGRSGQGPGELSRPAGIALDRFEILWVMNSGRYSGFDPGTGELIAEARRQVSFSMIPWPGLFDASGGLVDIGLDRAGQPVLLRLDSLFVPTDTLSLPQPDERHQILFRRGDVPVMSTTDPFAPQPTWAPHPRGGIIMGEGEAYRLHRIDTTGDTVMTIEVPSEPVPVSRSERDSALAVFEARSRAAGGTPSRQPRVHDNKPVHGALFIDDQNRIWVRRVGLPAPTWDVIGEDGRLLGQLAVPLSPGFVPPTVRGNRMVVVTNVDGVPTVVVYDLVRGNDAT